MESGDKVRIRPGGASVFVVIGPDDEDPDRVVIESVEDLPGKYPFPMRLSDLIPVEQA